MNRKDSKSDRQRDTEHDAARQLAQMDACRPDKVIDGVTDGEDELRSPEFSDLATQIASDHETRVQWQRIRDWDQKLRAELHDVPVPDGLAERLISQIQSQPIPNASEPNSDSESATSPREGVAAIAARGDATLAPNESLEDARVEVAAEASETVAPRVPLGNHLRGWLPVAAAAGLAASIVMAIFGMIAPEQSYSEDDLFSEARHHFDFNEGDVAVPDPATPPPADFPLSPHVLAAPAANVHWRKVDNFLGHKAVVYQLGGQQLAARLFVIKNTGPKTLTIPGLSVDVPPRQPATTGGFAMGAWQDSTSDSLFVLIVKGNESDYFRFLKTPSAVAMIHFLPHVELGVLTPPGPCRRQRLPACAEDSAKSA